MTAPVPTPDEAVERLASHYCGQTQPHAAHNWKTPPVYGSTTFVSEYQCAGVVVRADSHSETPACDDEERPDTRAAEVERTSTLTIEVIAKMWRDHAACTWRSDGTNVQWSCGIIHGLGGHSVEGLPIHMQPTTRDRHLAALVMTQVEAERILAARAPAREVIVHDEARMAPELVALLDDWDSNDEDDNYSKGDAANDLRAALRRACSACRLGQQIPHDRRCPERTAAPARDGLAERVLIERTIRRVFEHARENTDEIEGGQVPGAGWLHTAAAIDQWLRDRLAFELSETVPALLAEDAATEGGEAPTHSSFGDSRPTVDTVDLMLTQLYRDRETPYWGEPPHSESLDRAEAWLLSLRDHLEGSGRG